jgi:hypothetical protein
MKNEEKKAMIHARAQAQVERENHDIRMEQTRAEAKERSKAETEIGKMKSKLKWEVYSKVMKNEDGMLTNIVMSAGGLMVGGIFMYKLSAEIMRQVAAATTKPSLGKFNYS